MGGIILTMIPWKHWIDENSLYVLIVCIICITM